jgi:glycosyltransferase involved in cell wall biosynthesis
MPIRITLAHGVKGGMERHADTLAHGLAARGHHVTVVTTAHPEGLLEERNGGVDTLYTPNTTWRRYQGQWWGASYGALHGRHAAQRYDAILSQSAGGLGYLAAARSELGLPGVVILHGSALGEIATAWRGARTPRGAYRLARLAWRLPRLLARWRRVAPVVARWIAVSPAVARENAREIGFPAERATVVPNGVDTARFSPNPTARVATRQRLGLPAEAPVLAVVTRLEREKGVQVALQGLERLRLRYPNTRLLVAGAGAYTPALHRRAQALGVRDATLFLGLVDHADLPAILAAADAFVLPSLCHEAFPVSLVEALATGLPVVASAVGGTSTAVSSGVTGWLVPPGDAAALAAALDSLLADADRRREMSAAARRAAAACFSAEAMIAATEAVLADVVAGTDSLCQHEPRR